MESGNSLQIHELDEIPYHEPLTAGGCTRDSHRELTLGIGRFDSKPCPICKLEVYRP